MFCISSCKYCVELGKSWFQGSLIKKKIKTKIQQNTFHLFCQYKRETLKTTKYVELVIVADNREVRDLKGHGKHRWEMSSFYQFLWNYKECASAKKKKNLGLSHVMLLQS